MIFHKVPVLPTNINLTGKNVIVTGANTGIGEEVARHFYSIGANVTIASRNEEKAKLAIERMESMETKTRGSVRFERLDLGSFESVREFTEKIKQPLHLLVNNAGLIDTNNGKTVEGYNRTIGTNHFGPFLLTNLLLEPLRQGFQESAELSRVVFLSSMAHYNPGKFDINDIECKNVTGSMKLYGISKQMNTMTAIELDRREKENGIISLSVHPGFVNSDFGNEMTGLSGGAFSLLKSALARNNKDGAATSIVASIDPKVVEDSKYRGAYLDDNGTIKAPTKQAQSEQDCRILWEKTAEICKV